MKTAKQRAFAIYEKFPELMTPELQTEIIQHLQEAADDAKPRQLIAWPFEQVEEEFLKRTTSASVIYTRDSRDGEGLRYHLRFNGPMIQTLHLANYLAARCQGDYEDHFKKGGTYQWES